MKMNVLVVGVGPIGIEYSRILQQMGVSVHAVGRSQKGCDAYQAATGIAAASGLDNFLSDHPIDAAIVAVGEAQLGQATRRLLDLGLRHILVEKPGGSDAADIRDLQTHADRLAANVYVGYNRRFHASTLRAKEIIAEDGGVSSFTFEFTEWAHRIEPLVKEPGVKENWFLHNSTHVIDLAFHLGGWPRSFTGLALGDMNWHPHARYVGCGLTESGAPFSYSADWQAPGRWGVEIMTRKRRLILRPLESLQIQPLGSIAIEAVDLNDDLDIKYKPGFYRQVHAFLNAPSKLLSLADQVEHLDVYAQMHPGL